MYFLPGCHIFPTSFQYKKKIRSWFVFLSPYRPALRSFPINCQHPCVPLARRPQLVSMRGLKPLLHSFLYSSNATDFFFFFLFSLSFNHVVTGGPSAECTCGWSVIQHGAATERDQRELPDLALPPRCFLRNKTETHPPWFTARGFFFFYLRFGGHGFYTPRLWNGVITGWPCSGL